MRAYSLPAHTQEHIFLLQSQGLHKFPYLIVFPVAQRHQGLCELLRALETESKGNRTKVLRVNSGN